MLPSCWLFAVVGLLLLCSNNAQNCSNGVNGVEGFGMCCMAECGTCGGDGCRERAEAAFLTTQDCCATNIGASGVYCDDSQSAPCIIGSNETCSNGLNGVEGAGMCCNANCGTCGGFNCDGRARDASLTDDDCCTQNIRASGVYCDESQSAPCIIRSDETCSNGLNGVEGAGMCCMAECGTCGGPKCSVRARAVFLDPEDCCAQDIQASGVYCDDSQSAPCIIGSNETCSNGLNGVEGAGMCCNANCGTCGGPRCNVRAREASLTDDDCCAQNIRASRVYCDESQSAPCIIRSDETCSNGLNGVEGAGMCCMAECGTCGGPKCSVRARAVFLDPEDCCAQDIQASGVYCDDSQSAPCIIGSNETCSNGLNGVEGAGMCCNANCGTCGGTKCNIRAWAASLTDDDCCAQNIRASRVYCDESQSAPCIIRSNETCSNGLNGVEDAGVCCDAECGMCGGSKCNIRAEAVFLTPDDCCAQNIIASGVYCNDSQSAPCIINIDH